MNEKSCGSCRHVVTGARPACRRYPPQTHFILVPKKSVMAAGVIPIEEQRSAFPAVNLDWFCGEYAAKVVAP